MNTHNIFSSKTNYIDIIYGNPSKVNNKLNLNGKPIDNKEEMVYHLITESR